MKPSIFAIIAAMALSLPGLANAHSKLLSSNPGANASVVKPTELTLVFSESLLAPMSGVEIAMTAMPGMADHPPMPIKGFKTSVAPDGKTMIVSLPRPLPAGNYDLKWHIVGADQHKMEGGYSFTVK